MTKHDISSDAIDTTTERSPLLSRQYPQHHDSRQDVETAQPPRPASRPGHRRAAPSIASIAGSLHVPKTHNPQVILAIICVVVLIGSGSGGLFGIPMTRILEDRLCHEYYGRVRTHAELQEPIDEELCKVETIQSKLAYLFATASVLEAVVGCTFAMPWGIAADRIGRRPVFAIALTGMLFTEFWGMIVAYIREIPIHYYWLGPLGHALGGGNAVLSATLSSMMADILPEQDRAIGFMRIHVSSMIGNLCSPALSSVLMPVVGPWPLLWASQAMTAVSAIAILFVPETLTHHRKASGPDENDAGVGALDAGSLVTRVRRSLVELRDSLSMLTSRSVVLLMLVTLTMMPILFSTLQFLPMFASKRYHMPLAQTGYIQGAYGAAQLVVVMVVVPWISAMVMRPGVPRAVRMPDEKTRDLVLLRWSFVALCLGTLAMSVSPVLPGFVCGLVLMSFGSGASSFVKSTLAALVDQEHRTRMFSLQGIVDIMGSIYALPSLAGLFTAGMKLGGLWIGLPYLGVAILCAFDVGLLAFVRPPVVSLESDHAGLTSDSESDTVVEDDSF
ncbi:hypothetical protein JX266_013665 [Neoarthrinium moseri]|nr:hypothetical protein JX266_013665 [Neoarthrinium moseri]